MTEAESKGGQTPQKNQSNANTPNYRKSPTLSDKFDLIECRKMIKQVYQLVVQQQS